MTKQLKTLPKPSLSQLIGNHVWLALPVVLCIAAWIIAATFLTPRGGTPADLSMPPAERPFTVFGLDEVSK